MAKTWMVEQLWTVTVEGDPMTVPVRGVVEAKTKKEAEAGAEKACREAAEQIGMPEGAKPKSKAQAMYAI